MGFWGKWKNCGDTVKSRNQFIQPASVIPTAVNLVNIHPAARKIIVRSKIKSPRRPVIVECPGAVRFVGIIDGKDNSLFCFLRVENEDSMIDEQFWETNN